jgi:hypothetical protein
MVSSRAAVAGSGAGAASSLSSAASARRSAARSYSGRLTVRTAASVRLAQGGLEPLVDQQHLAEPGAVAGLAYLALDQQLLEAAGLGIAVQLGGFGLQAGHDAGGGGRGGGGGGGHGSPRAATR